MTVNLSMEQNTMETSKGTYKTNIFLDAAIRYMMNKRLDFQLHMNNLLNRKTYINTSFSGLNYNFFNLPLRGREIMLKASMKI